MRTSHHDVAEATEKLRRQQAALVQFGVFAFGNDDPRVVLAEAARLCAEGLGVEYCQVLRYRSEHDDLVIEASYGWKENILGRTLALADTSSPASRAFRAGEAVVISDWAATGRAYAPPLFYGEHAVLASIDAVMHGQDKRPFGILEGDSQMQRTFDRQEIDFLAAFADFIAEAAAKAERLAELRRADAAKGAAIAELNLLARENQHRVRNDLQLIMQLQQLHLRRLRDDDAKRGAEGIIRKLMTLAKIYDHLLGVGLMRRIDFAEYLLGLCDSIRLYHADSDAGIALVCETTAVEIDLERATLLGLVANELIANSYEHAFPTGHGEIRVTVRREAGDRAVLTIQDDGTGLTAAPDPRQHGTALVRKIVERLDGSVEVVSGEGTRWDIRFRVE